MQLIFLMVRNQKIRKFKEMRKKKQIPKEIQYALYGLKLTKITPTLELQYHISCCHCFPPHLCLKACIQESVHSILLTPL